jgi:6-phosphogluconate dehydrogenase (decarboxylating)
MVRRLVRHGHECVVYDVSAGRVQELSRESAVGVSSLAEFVKGAFQTACGLDDAPCRRGRRHDR